MLAYWLMFIFPAIVAIQMPPVWGSGTGNTRTAARFSVDWFFIVTGLTLIIGLRYEVGGDWGNYFRYLSAARLMNIKDLAAVSDPAYWALNMLSAWLGWGITGVNLFSGFLFAAGLVVFCLNLTRPWLALGCAMPYLVTVVAMGYTRQSVALGLAMIGLVALQKGRYIRFAIWILVAALFHKSAIILILLAALVVNRNRIKAVGLIGLLAFFGYEFILSDHVDQLTRTYVDANVESVGALIRLGMNVVPALLFLTLHKRFMIGYLQKRLWIIISSLSVVMFLAFFFANLSTALDRMALYFIPIQLVVYANLPDAIGSPGRRNQAIVAGILFYYGAALFVWLNFSHHSDWWLPYSIGFG
jgi:hypothetical protein